MSKIYYWKYFLVAIVALFGLNIASGYFAMLVRVAEKRMIAT